MKNVIIFGSKWVIYSCVTALIVGIALVSPLLILNTVSDPFSGNYPVTPNPQSADCQIAINIKSVQANLGTVMAPVDISSTEIVSQPGFSGTITVNATKYLNSNTSIPDAESDYFLMQISTDTGVILQNCTLDIGTTYNESLTTEQQQLLNDYQLWKSLGNYTGGTALFVYRWSIGTIQENSLEFSSTISPSIAALVENSQTLTLTLSRIGTITVKGNYASVLVTNDGFIENMTLTRSGDTFVYNA